VGPDCCQAGQVPPNHCCGAQYNPTGDPAQCCSLYRTVQNCCSTFPASDPVLCLCLQQGICGPLAEPEPQAQATQPADPQVPVTGQASAPPERAPVRVAGHAAAA
jgi:hypothetical protein